MRHKYETRAFVLSRASVGEANTFLTLLTKELGLVRARAQGLRRPGAKLAHALTTLAESEVTLVRGKLEWRLAGAVPIENWFARLTTRGARERAGRMSSLLMRLVAGEADDPSLYAIFAGFLEALASAPTAMHDAAEVLAALRILGALGFDDSAAPGDPGDFAPRLLEEVAKERGAYVLRVNRGIAASGL